MPRVRVQREPCDCFSCMSIDNRPISDNNYVALARQLPPAKSLVIVVDDAIFSDPSQPSLTSLDLVSHPHLDSISREGCSGLAYVRKDSSSQAQSPLLGQFLLAAPQACPSPQPFPDRFKQIHAGVITNSTFTKSVAKSLGIDVIHTHIDDDSMLVIDVHDKKKTLLSTLFQFPSIDATVELISRDYLRICPVEEYVQLHSTAPHEDSTYDMVMILLSMNSSSLQCNGIDSQQHHQHQQHEKGLIEGDATTTMDAACHAIYWVDTLLQRLDAVPGFKDTVLLTVVLGSSALPSNDNSMYNAVHTKTSICNSVDGIKMPVQSYRCSGMEYVDVEEESPAVVIHRLSGIIRYVLSIC